VTVEAGGPGWGGGTMAEAHRVSRRSRKGKKEATVGALWWPEVGRPTKP